MRDKEFDKYLEGDSELSQLYRQGANLEPPAEVDAAILAEARKALKPKARMVSSPFASNWTVPLSLAAILVLCVGLVLFIKEDSVMLTTPETSKTPLSDKIDGEATGGRRDLNNNKTENAPLNRLGSIAPKRKLSGKVTSEDRSIKQSVDKTTTPAPKKAYGPNEIGGDSSSTTKGRYRYKKQKQVRGRQVKEDIALPAVQREQAKDKDTKAKAVEKKKSRIVNQAAEALLAKIRKLRKAGKNRRADRNLELFKRRYPNYSTDYPTDNTVEPAAKQ